jgi:hypothetical protein
MTQQRIRAELIGYRGSGNTVNGNTRFTFLQARLSRPQPRPCVQLARPLNDSPDTNARVSATAARRPRARSVS